MNMIQVTNLMTSLTYMESALEPGTQTWHIDQYKLGHLLQLTTQAKELKGLQDPGSPGPPQLLEARYRRRECRFCGVLSWYQNGRNLTPLVPVPTKQGHGYGVEQVKLDGFSP